MSDIKVDILRVTKELVMQDDSGNKTLLRPGTGLLDASGAALGAGDTFIKAYRTTDGTPVNNSTVLVADDVLKFAIGANEVWGWVCDVFFNDPSGANMKLSFSGPAGVTAVKFGPLNQNSEAGSSPRFASAFGTTMTLGTNTDSNNNDFISLVGTVINGATPGTVQLEFAQASAAMNDLQILKCSKLIAHKLSA